MPSKKIIFFIFSIVFMITIFQLSEVDTSLTKEDIKIIRQLNLDNNCINTDTIVKQIECVSSIQNKIFSIVLVSHDGIGYNRTREPKDLVKEKKGLCYDRSRFIEKVFTFYNINYRHVAIHFTDDNSSFPYLKKGSFSHAFTEIYTSKGWMVVDSIEPFIGMDKKGKVYTAKAIKEKQNFKDIHNNTLPLNLTLGDYSVIYGLYSRHGKYYPPYNKLPDINWGQFLYYNIPFVSNKIGVSNE